MAYALVILKIKMYLLMIIVLIYILLENILILLKINNVLIIDVLIFILTIYINQCSFRKNRIKNNVKDFYYESKVNDKPCLLRIDTGSDISIINSNFVESCKPKIIIDNC